MTEYLDDVPEIDEDTTAKELVDFTKQRAENPIEIEGTTIYNFNSHKPDYEELEKAINGKLERDTYLIPFQVTGAWLFMLHLLPQDIREAEVLIYRENIETYYAYRNFVREVPDEWMESVREDIAVSIHDKYCGSNA